MKTITLILALVFSFNATAQFTDGCDAVLRLASKDVSNEVGKANTAKYIYDQYCENSDIKKGIDIRFVADDLFESYDFGFGSKSETLKAICKTYQSNYRQVIERNSSSSTVVREAISSWEKCKELSNLGIKIKPNILPTQFSVDLARQGDDIIINGVDYDTKNCECKGLVKKADGTKELQILNSETVHVIDDGNTWSVRCKRKSTEEEGVKYYESIDFSVPTSKGTFSMTLPKDIKPTQNWISEIQKEMDD